MILGSWSAGIWHGRRKIVAGYFCDRVALHLSIFGRCLVDARGISAHAYSWIRKSSRIKPLLWVHDLIPALSQHTRPILRRSCSMWLFMYLPCRTISGPASEQISNHAVLWHERAASIWLPFWGWCCKVFKTRLGSFDYAVLLDGLPLPYGCSRVKPLQ